MAAGACQRTLENSSFAFNARGEQHAPACAVVHTFTRPPWTVSPPSLPLPCQWHQLQSVQYIVRATGSNMRTLTGSTVFRSWYLQNRAMRTVTATVVTLLASCSRWSRVLEGARQLMWHVRSGVWDHVLALTHWWPLQAAGAPRCR